MFRPARHGIFGSWREPYTVSMKAKDLREIQKTCLWVAVGLLLLAGFVLFQAVQSGIQTPDRLNPQAVAALTLLWLMPLPVLLGAILFAHFGALAQAEAHHLESRDPEGVRRDE
ncbi:MAG: hypothetical protein A3F84_25880 [Candidatus Handelsmanbacteria bacterium RIFCSPLOWO2_12_FULL_64_10]|uniref:Uncharacterized protein n=1 Tax=Handelsmanbacteria sp. (strain RIFCSPLOWO2_12_FULL_64_10) TaxID=1817868 RepID=A0A1F6CSF6_HANXR|nr:MAG: hypothetical protein A3F84_25880 [Candidatus Handelsmanbacteria bacterium RIFCSPLOWO2_12_FULL_64_10]